MTVPGEPRRPPPGRTSDRLRGVSHGRRQFLAGWSSHNVTTGVVMAIALGAGVAMPVFHGDAHKRWPHRRPS